MKNKLSSSPAAAAAAQATEIAAAEHTHDLETTTEHLRAQLREKDGIIRKFRESRGGQIEIAHRICEAVTALQPGKLLPYTPKDKSKSEVMAVANLSDLHIGEMIRPAETGGFGAFNYAIAQDRMATYATNLIDWVRIHRLGYNIPDLTIFGIGDYISGDIHQELLVTNEFPLPGQTARAGLLIAEFVRSLSPHFRKITFHGVGADNHGRLQKKPQAKQKSANNMSFLVHALVGAYLAELPNFQMVDHEDISPLIEVARHQFIVTHGDTIKSVMGIPWYGLERFIGKEAIRRLGKKEFHYVNCGHYHTAIFLQRLLMNSSLSGTTEFDHACGRFGQPGQITYLVHPRWGVFDFVPWRFSVESEETDARHK